MIAIDSFSRNSTAIAILGRAQNFLQYGGDVGTSLPSSEMIGAIYASIFFGPTDSNSNIASLDVTPTCSTGNCTFPPFQSLAVCSSCENLTAVLNQTCDPQDDGIYCQFSLSNGLTLNISVNEDFGGAVASSGYLPPVGRPKHGNSLLNFSIINWPFTDQSSNHRRNISATQCFLYWCVNQYKSRVENGRLHEEIMGHWSSDTTQWAMDLAPLSISKRLELVPSGLDKSSSASTFTVAFVATNALSSWLAEKLTCIDGDENHGNVIIDENSFQETLSPIQNSNLSLVFQNIAKSMTSIIRSYSSSQQSHLSTVSDKSLWNISGVGPVNGTTHYNQVYISVRWHWLAFSGAIIVLTVIHLIFTIFDTARHDMRPWKSSPIALLFHGLNEAETDQLRKTSELARMEVLASQIDVQLRDSGDGFKFTR